jgi:hypothetical protein
LVTVRSKNLGRRVRGQPLATGVPTIAIFPRRCASAEPATLFWAAQAGFDDFAIGLLHRNSVHYMIEAFFVLIPLVICSSSRGRTESTAFGARANSRNCP